MTFSLGQVSKYTRVQHLFENNGSNSVSKGVYQDSTGKNVTLPNKWTKMPNSHCIYKEVIFTLADTDQTEKFTYFEQTSGKKCQFYVISPTLFDGETELFEGKTIEESRRACLNRLACTIERYTGNTLSCNSDDRDMLEPLPFG